METKVAPVTNKYWGRRRCTVRPASRVQGAEPRSLHDRADIWSRDRFGVALKQRISGGERNVFDTSRGAGADRILGVGLQRFLARLPGLPGVRRTDRFHPRRRWCLPRGAGGKPVLRSGRRDASRLGLSHDQRKDRGIYAYVGALAFTSVWAFWEVGLSGWQLIPRLVGPFVLLVLANSRTLPHSTRRLDGVRASWAWSASEFSLPRSPFYPDLQSARGAAPTTRCASKRLVRGSRVCAQEG